MIQLGILRSFVQPSKDLMEDRLIATFKLPIKHTCVNHVTTGANITAGRCHFIISINRMQEADRMSRQEAELGYKST